MENAYNELDKTLTKLAIDWNEIEWGHISCNNKEALLKPGYTKEDLEKYKGAIERIGDYDNGFGSQKLFGVVVFKDGTWLERREYDGSEWWNYSYKPTYEAFIKDSGENK